MRQQSAHSGTVTMSYDYDVTPVQEGPNSTHNELYTACEAAVYRLSVELCWQREGVRKRIPQ